MIICENACLQATPHSYAFGKICELCGLILPSKWEFGYFCKYYIFHCNLLKIAQDAFRAFILVVSRKHGWLNSGSVLTLKASSIHGSSCHFLWNVINVVLFAQIKNTNLWFQFFILVVIGEIIFSNICPLII